MRLASERLKHVDLVRAGAPSFMVMCRAKDVLADPRAVASFDKNDVFVGGTLLEIDGNYWLERTERRPIANVRPQLKAQLPT